MNTPFKVCIQESGSGQKHAKEPRAGAPCKATRPPPGGPAPVIPRLDKGTHSDSLVMVLHVHDFGDQLVEVTFGPRIRSLPKKSKRGLSEARDENEDRAARRAKAQLRRKVMAMGADRLLTLTYRENVTEFEKASQDLSRCLRLIRREYGEFPYVAVAERQKRGAVHWHLAIRGFRKVDVLRSLWRRIVGDGNIDIAFRGRDSRKDSVNVAGYLAKYLTKSYQESNLGGLNQKRYRTSKGIVVPEERYEFASVDELMAFMATVSDGWGHMWMDEDGLYGSARTW